MKLGKNTKALLNEEFTTGKKYAHLTPGKALRIYRELNGFSQNELAEKTALKQTTISALENDRITLGIERAKVLGAALKVHPGLLAFADWDSDEYVA